ncbi:ATP-binding cassette domain-containing protein [Maribacter algarum]|nr:ATP-binding cassette domain-containing protein [Maribacter algarum]
MKHWAVFITNDSNKSRFVHRLLAGNVPELAFPKGFRGALLSKLALERFMDEEDRHGTKIITQGTQQALRTMSSGEQKKALLNHLFENDHDFIVLDNPFDNLDTGSQKELTKTLEEKSKQTIFIQIISRKEDLLSFIENFGSLKKDELSINQTLEKTFTSNEVPHYVGSIPNALNPIEFNHDILIQLKDVTVKFGNKTVLQKLNWTIKKGEFWQLFGKNGSGKTTILSMVTGENPKGYGQNLFLFGKKKGSGESIWDVKKNIGYFTPAMTDKFKGYHTIENMLVSGLNDSIGLYLKPTESQLRLAKKWLKLINLWEEKDTLFHDLSAGQKRLVMTTRAMIKRPLLLILDEPTAGLDDASAKLLVDLVNKISRESDTATIFVSHRKEPGLDPDFIYELQMQENGSTGRVISSL